MALSMDEQRVLAEIERRLAAEEPALAACLTSFRRPGPALMFKSPRARILGSVFTVALVAVISLMVYSIIPFRGHVPRTPADRNASQSVQTSVTAASSDPGPSVAVPRNTSPVNAAGNTRAKVRVATPRTAAPRTASSRSAGKGTPGTAKPVMGGTGAIR